jgi:FkbM family methyltransferase
MFSVYASWLWSLIKGLINFRRQEILIVTPPCVRTQMLFFRGKRHLLLLNNNADYNTFRQIFHLGCYDVRKFKFYELLLRRYRSIVNSGCAPLIVDCGSNLGYATKFFSLLFPDANFLMIEPLEKSVSIAAVNTSKINATLVKGAIASRSGVGNIEDAKAHSTAVRVVQNKEGNIQFYSIADLIREKGRKSKCFIIKIDIEGFEKDLFSSNVDWFDSFSLVIIELHDWMLPGQHSSLPFLKLISNKNIDFIVAGENVFVFNYDAIKNT